MNQYELSRGALTQAIQQLALKRDHCGYCSRPGEVYFDLSMNGISKGRRTSVSQESEYSVLNSNFPLISLMNWVISTEMKHDNQLSTWKFTATFKQRSRSDDEGKMLWLANELSRYNFQLCTCDGGRVKLDTNFGSHECTMSKTLPQRNPVPRKVNFTFKVREITANSSHTKGTEVKKRQEEGKYWRSYFKMKTLNPSNPYPFEALKETDHEAHIYGQAAECEYC
eukprot:IDg19176t1